MKRRKVFQNDGRDGELESSEKNYEKKQKTPHQNDLRGALDLKEDDDDKSEEEFEKILRF